MAVRKAIVLVGGRFKYLPAADTLDVPFSWLSGKPTTLAGYGITDAAPSANPNLTGLVQLGFNYISALNPNTLNGGYSNNGLADMWINYRGYIDGFTQFRDFRIGDGKGAQVAAFQGSDKSLTLAGALNAVGATFTGPVVVGTAGVNGYSRIDAGAPNAPGTIGFYTQEGIRRGYIGWASGTNLLITAENGWKYDFGGIAPTINGSAIHTAASFDPATKLGVSAKAADSNMLSGVTLDRVVFGQNNTATTTFADMNTPVKSGFYERAPGGGVQNSADGTDAWNWFLHHQHTNNSYGFQLSNIIGSNDLYIRGLSGGVWGSWNKFWHSGNFNPALKANADTPTFTGEVRVNNGNGTITHFNYINNGSNYIRGTETHIDTPQVYRTNANSGETRQPRHFVQATDPGLAAVDGDIWTNTA